MKIVNIRCAQELPIEALTDDFYSRLLEFGGHNPDYHQGILYFDVYSLIEYDYLKLMFGWNEK